MNRFTSLLSRLVGEKATADAHAKNRFQPRLEPLEDRAVPAFVASQLPAAAFNPLTLSANQVRLLLDRAAAATSTDNAIVAVVDRNGSILGVRVEGNVSPTITSNANLLDFAIDGAVSEARTGAFFSSNAAPLTSRTVQFISQSTITQREVNSYTFDSNPNSTTGGPGTVAPIGIGGHFPPNISNTPQVDLFDIEHTNRDMLVNPGPSGVLNTPLNPSADNVGLVDRFNDNPAFIPAGKGLVAPLSYHDTILPPAQQNNPAVAHVASRGVGTLPGGIPLYEDGVLVGAIGVFFPGKTGFASEENSNLSSNYDPSKPDLAREAEFIAFAAAGGSTQANFPVGTLGGIPKLPGFDLPFKRIDLVGISLDLVGPGGLQGPQNLANYITSHFSVGTGNPLSGVNEPVNSTAATLLPGRAAPEGWLVLPHAGAGITAAQVTQIINQGITQANQTRAQLRPLGTTTRMVLAVTDENGNVVGLYRMPDAPIFSINVAVSKARDAAYYDNPAQLNPVDQLPGVPAGASFSARTFRYLALPHFPEGIDPNPPAPFSILNDPGVNRSNGLSTAATPISAFTSILGYNAFHPNTTFRAPGPPVGPAYQNRSGVVFFPGSSAVYVNNKIVGGFGVSGDGVDEDDVVTSNGAFGFGPPLALQADQFFYGGIRLPYQKYDRNPEG